MFKKILRLFIVGIAATAFISSCKEDDGVPYTYTSEIDATGTNFSDVDHYQEHMVLLFSTDGGVNYSNTPALKEGQTYKVMVFFNGTPDVDETILTAANYTFDWSQSDPKPNGDATSDVAEFTLHGDESNLAKVKVFNTHCPYVASSWTGDWKGFENGTCCGGTDNLTIRQDTSDPTYPNRFIMSNYWGDGPAVEVYFDLNPSTSFFDQDITMPEQTTSEDGVAVGSGTYDQCAGTMAISTTYEIGGGSYSWVYELYREE